MSICVLLTAAVTGTTTAAGASGTHRAGKKRGHLIAHVPREQAVAFAVLRDPRTRTSSRALRRLGRSPIAATMGLNIALSRAVPEPAGGAGRTWYVVPGAKGLCLSIAFATVCNTAQEAVAGHLNLTMFPSRAGTEGHTTIMGLVPDGVTGVTAVQADGTTVSGSVARNVFRLAGDGLVRVQLDRVGADPLVIFESALPPVVPAG